MTAVVAQDRVVGVFTDGDLRRALDRDVDVRTVAVDTVMSRNPVTVRPDLLAAEALALMESRKINALLVTEPEGRLVGALNMHDLLRARVV
jgi:arabinose-5-phosphate isomerase